jgi:non-specific serine/threonine protein kinase
VCQAESVRLFVERAAAYNPSFALTEQIAGAVTQVCQRLDGLPLAIELAARVVALPVQQLAPRLDERFRLLVGGSRTADPRHQTLRAAVDWSYELLTGAERVFFQRLSVFVDGFELEAVEAVCISDGVEPEDLLGLLLQLVDKSLVNAHSQGGNARYRLLETLREYGWEQLAASGQARAVQARHAAYYLVFAEQVASQLDGPAFAAWLDRLEQDHGNLRAALRWFGDRREVEASLRLSLALWRFWGARGHLSEGRGWFQAALAESDGAPPAVQAEALEAAGTLAWYQGDRAAAASLLEASLALRRESGDTERTAGVLNALGAVRRQQGEYLKAESLFEEALAIFRELGNQPGMATTLNKIGLLASDQQDYARAVDVHWRALSLQRAPDSRPGLAESLDGLARATAGRRHYLQAARLYGAASAISEPDAGLVPLVDRVAREQSLATVRARLGEHAFARARENGRAMPLADAVAYARTTLAQLPEALHSSAPTSPDAHPAERAAAPQSPAELGSIRLPALAFGHPALTARERDVTRLIAGGLSNREIAEELVVSVRTVERHITNLYAKLGARGKAAAIAYALRHGLVRT